MSETNNTKNVRDDEIDLLDLFKRMGQSIGRMANALGRGLLITTVFVFRKWLPLGISIAIGIGASYIFKMTSESLYTSDLLLHTNEVSASDLISYINRLHTFCIENNKTSIGNALSVTPAQVNNIVDISAFWVIDKGNDKIPDLIDYENKHDVYDTINVRMKDRIDVRVSIKAPQELTNVRDGIIKFIKADSLFQQRNRLKKRQDQELLTRLDYDIIQLDSLQKVKYFEETRNMQPKNGGQMIFLQEQKTQLVYNDIYELYKRKQVIETNLDLYKDIVTVLSDFSFPVNRINGTIYYGKYIIPLFFFLALLILILLSNRKKIKELFNKY